MSTIGHRAQQALSKKGRLIRARAIEQGRCCYWCKREMILPGEPGYYRVRDAISRRGATLDHLYGLHHPLRFDKTVPRRNVVACDKCNRKRGQVENTLWLRHGKLEPRVYLPNENLEKNRVIDGTQTKGKI